MKTIYYRHESAAARAYADKHKLHYQGRERLNTTHVGDDAEALAKAMDTLHKIKEESDYFWGQIESREGGERWTTELPGKGQPLGSLVTQAQRDLGGRIKINEVKP